MENYSRYANSESKWYERPVVLSEKCRTGSIFKKATHLQKKIYSKKSLCACTLLLGDFSEFLFILYVIQHCFICHPSDSTVSEGAGIEPRIVATLALTARRFNNHSALIHGRMTHTDLKTWTN